MRGAEPELQALQALIAFTAGMAAAFCYELLTILLRKLRSPILQVGADLLFGCGCSLMLFLIGLVSGRGELRLFMPLLLLSGALAYLVLLHTPGRYLAARLLSFVSLLCFPIAMLLRMGKFFLLFHKNLFHYLVRWFTIRHQAIVSLQGLAKENT